MIYYLHSIYNLHSNPGKLDYYEKLETHHPKYVWEKVKNNPKEQAKFESVLAKDPDTALSYATFTEKPFPLGEPAIATSFSASYNYAKNIVKGPWPLGEPAIATRAEKACLYALYILKKPFPLGEPVIAKDAAYSVFYAKRVLKKPFPPGEPAIAKNNNFYEDYLEIFPDREQAILELQKKS